MKKKLEILDSKRSTPAPHLGNSVTGMRGGTHFQKLPTAPEPLHRPLSDARITVQDVSSLSTGVRGAVYRFCSDERDVFLL